MNNMGSDNTSRMRYPLSRAKLLTLWCDFYEKIKSNKVLSTENHDWANVLIYEFFKVVLFFCVS